MSKNYKIESNHNSFYIRENNEIAAKMEFSRAGDSMLIISSTTVLDNYRGLGLGLILLSEIVTLARKENYKIIPLCPFAKAMFNRYPKFSDVLKN